MERGSEPPPDSIRAPSLARALLIGLALAYGFILFPLLLLIGSAAADPSTDADADGAFGIVLGSAALVVVAAAAGLLTCRRPVAWSAVALLVLLPVFLFSGALEWLINMTW